MAYKPMTRNVSFKLEGIIVVLITHSLLPSGVVKLVSKTWIVPGTYLPMLLRTPNALVDESVGLALPSEQELQQNESHFR